MLKPDVSIIVAVYNAETCLRRCLDSLVNQTHKNIEIICVNDASTDSSQSIIDEYAQKDGRVKSVIHEKNMNAGGAMNDGIKAAKASYVCIVDNDDWLSIDAIEQLLEESENKTEDIVTPKWIEYKSSTEYVIKNNLLISSTREENIIEGLKHGWRLLGNLIKKDLFVKNNLFFPENVFYEDNAIAFCILFLANSIKTIDIPMYYYASADTSVTNTLSLAKLVDRIHTTEMFMKEIQKRGFYKEPFVEYINCKYLKFSFNTLDMMTKFEIKETFYLFTKVRKGIYKYRKKSNWIKNRLYWKMLLFPTVYYLKRSLL